MKTAKRIAVSAVMTALLISIQYLLNFASGIELVTIFFFAFCFSCGMVCGIAVGICFSLLRCFIFGFLPQVIVLYLIYYPLFAIAASFSGKILKDKKSYIKIIFATLTIAVLSVFFTLLDDVIAPIMFGFTRKAWSAYFYASLPVMLIQSLFAASSSLVLFFPLEKIFGRVMKD